jgi:hypothetical protein
MIGELALSSVMAVAEQWLSSESWFLKSSAGLNLLWSGAEVTSRSYNL